MNDRSEEIIAYFGHPKCGSTWLSGVFLDIGYLLGLRIFYGQLPLYTKEKIFANHPQLLISQNTSYDFVKNLQSYKAFHVIRDPRDVIVSSYFSYKNTHEIGNWYQLAELRNQLNSKPMSDGLFDIIDFNVEFYQFMSDWNYADSNVLEMKFEELTADPASCLSSVFRFLGIYDDTSGGDGLQYLLNYGVSRYNRLATRMGFTGYYAKYGRITSAYIDQLCDKLSFKRLSKGRKTGQVNTNSHYRSGKSGEWQDYLNDSHLQYLEEKCPGLIQKLGYHS